MPIKTKVKTKSGLNNELKTEVALLHQIIETISQSENLDVLLQHIAKVLAATLKFDSSFVYLIDGKVLTLLGAWPPHPYQVGKLHLESGEGIAGWVAQNKKPVSIQKNAFTDPRFKVFSNLPEDRYSSLLSVPVVLDDKTIGVINLQNKKQRTFSPALIRLIVSVSSQVSRAIERTRLFESTAKKSKQLETIAQLSRSIVSNTYTHEILQLIVALTAQMMNSKICSLMLYDEKTQELRIEATQSLSEDYKKKPPLKVSQSVSGRALELKQPVAVLDVTKEPGYSYPSIAKKEGLKSMLAVPMLVKNNKIGVINCYSTSEHVFTGEEIAVMQTIASQSAIAIENTRLLEESQSAKEALETRKIIERAKGLLMKEKNMDEQEAFQFIQRQAMNMRRTMREIAEAILLSDGLKNNSPQG
jgi:signal transduction protein with GAF and PtsI domain